MGDPEVAYRQLAHAKRFGGTGRTPAEDEAEREKELETVRRQRKHNLKLKKNAMKKEKKKLRRRIMLKAADLTGRP